MKDSTIEKYENEIKESQKKIDEAISNKRENLIKFKQYLESASRPSSKMLLAAISSERNMFVEDENYAYYTSDGTRNVSAVIVSELFDGTISRNALNIYVGFAEGHHLKTEVAIKLNYHNVLKVTIPTRDISDNADWALHR